MKDILKKIYLFKELSEEELGSLGVISSLSSYKKDSLLFMSGEVGTQLIILIEGDVSVFKHDNKGNEIVIGFFSPYSLIAEAAILRGIAFPSSAVFKTDGRVLKIDMDSFRSYFLTNPKVSTEIINSLLSKIQLLQQNIHLNIASTAKEKILHLYETNASIVLKLKKYEIATLLGMSPETFSRNLNSLISDKQLEKTSNGYEIVIKS
ncbi:Crp/Fnr family transcriptional regulator [Sulfurimonas sp. SAG-AH-194-C21]|nr:Crp/Fnr family transcriptional regulator [Sulfurimonas sp. SAG-AH-194-C21]MDF1883618.1 Crp/Fnr family transcriptional regulator [Sulfurimonas sp. SAG-AH-194-C21]